VGALNAAAETARHLGESNDATTYAQDAYQISQLLQIHNWDDTLGHYLDYRRTGDYGGHPLIENHLALDTLLALRFDATTPDKAEHVLTAMHDRLQTRNNVFQPYEDWGVMSCWPPYRHRADVFGRSSRAYNFHNGAEWPYLSAIYAQLLLERGDPDWHYVLTRWWEIQLEHGWLTPVEFHTPAHPVGAPLQGWSSLFVGAMLAGGLALRPALNGKSTPHVPPWGASTFRYLNIRGQERTVTVDDDGVKLE
jgi:glycogen debranching enzyme